MTKTTKLPTIVAGAFIALLSLSADNLNAQTVNVELGKTRSMRLKTQIAAPRVSGGGNVAKVWFDSNSNRLKVKGIGVGFARVIFTGREVRYVAGNNNGRLRRDLNFRHELKIYVRRASQPVARPRAPKVNRQRAPRRRAKPVVKAPQKIVRQTTWTLGRGRVKSIGLEGVLNGRITREYGLAVRHKSVAIAKFEKGRLKIKGLRRGSTAVVLRGKVLKNWKLVPFVITINVVVR